MSFVALKKVVSDQFKNNWSATIQRYVDYGDNHNFTPPQDEEWVRLTVNPTNTENAEVGTGQVIYIPPM